MSDLPEKLAFVDIETTGGSLYQDRIIEIGILRVENNQIVKTYETLVNPDMNIAPEIQALTGISPQDVETAPSFYSVKDEIQELLDDCVFVAHNVRFDYGFIRTELKREDVTFKAKQLCTCKLSRQLFPRFKRHNLDAVIERCGFNCERRHRAFDDAKVLWDFYQLIQEKFGVEKVIEACERTLKRPSVPLHLTNQMLDDLPESPGVYIFYGDEGMPLYIGKSVNIRDRVLSHFSADHTSTTELKITQQIKSIEALETAGELGALIKESDLIKKMQPLYNRKLRHAHGLVTLNKKITADGYFSVDFETADVIAPQSAEEILGIFKSKKQATNTLVELAKEYQLCQKLLGVEHGNGTCFGYGLNWCKGACAQKEIPAFYNVRFIEAFAKYKIQRWPFDSAIMIKEEKLENGEAHVIDKWCYLGKATFSNREDTQFQLTHDVHFDHDIYKILVRYLHSPQSRRTIKQISLDSFISDSNSESTYSYL